MVKDVDCQTLVLLTGKIFLKNLRISVRQPLPESDADICSNTDEEVFKRQHSCTDVPCLLIFGAFFAAWTALGVIAFSKGDITRFVQGDFFNWAPPEFAKCWPLSN